MLLLHLDNLLQNIQGVLWFFMLCSSILKYHAIFEIYFFIFRVAEGNMEAVFHFAFELVDKNALTLDFVVVLVEKIVS